MRRVLFPVIAVVGSIAVADVARADCCDSFWSCVGTVVTGGLSCEIEETIATVQALASAVQTLGSALTGQTSDAVNQAQGTVVQAASDMGQLRQQSVAALAEAAQTSRAIVAPKVGMFARSAVALHEAPAKPPANAERSGVMVDRAVGANAVAPLMRPADPAAVTDILSRADTYVHNLQNQGNTQAAPVAQAETAAVGAANRHVSVAQQISSAIALAPIQALEGMLSDLLSHPERIFDPSAEIDAQISNISSQVPALLVRIFNEVTGEAMGYLNQAQNPLQQLQDSAEGGSAVVLAMQKLSTAGSQSDFDALARLLPPPPPPQSSQLAMARTVPTPAGIVGHHELVAAAISRAQPTKIPLYVRRKAAVDDLAVRWQAIKAKAKIPPHVDASVAQKVDHDLTQKFAGKSGADLAQTKQDLLNQAAKRFANEPKTLEKVRQYIEAHAKG